MTHTVNPYALGKRAGKTRGAARWYLLDALGLTGRTPDYVLNKRVTQCAISSPGGVVMRRALVAISANDNGRGPWSPP